MDKNGRKTPWGAAQTVTAIKPGVYAYTTAGHGGLWVEPELDKKIPKAARKEASCTPAGWYEEDCEWAIPYYYLHLDRHDEERGEQIRAAAIKTIEHYYPNLTLEEV